MRMRAVVTAEHSRRVMHNVTRVCDVLCRITRMDDIAFARLLPEMAYLSTLPLFADTIQGLCDRLPPGDVRRALLCTGRFVAHKAREDPFPLATDVDWIAWMDTMECAASGADADQKKIRHAE